MSFKIYNNNRLMTIGNNRGGVDPLLNENPQIFYDFTSGKIENLGTNKEFSMYDLSIFSPPSLTVKNGIYCLNVVETNSGYSNACLNFRNNDGLTILVQLMDCYPYSNFPTSNYVNFFMFHSKSKGWPSSRFGMLAYRGGTRLADDSAPNSVSYVKYSNKFLNFIYTLDYSNNTGRWQSYGGIYNINNSMGRISISTLKTLSDYAIGFGRDQEGYRNQGLYTTKFVILNHIYEKIYDFYPFVMDIS